MGHVPNLGVIYGSKSFRGIFFQFFGEFFSILGFWWWWLRFWRCFGGFSRSGGVFVVWWGFCGGVV